MGQEIKIVCLNLWNGGELFDNILAFLKKEQADILALQEVRDGCDPAWERQFRSRDVLAAELNYPHHVFSRAFWDTRDEPAVENGNAILSRFPIRSNREVFFDIPYGNFVGNKTDGFTHVPRNLQHAVIDINSLELNVFNTQGIWGFDGHDTDRRLAMGATIAKEVAGMPHTILAGDFNVQEGTKTTDVIEAHLMPVFKVDHRVSSFNMKHKTDGGYGTAIVDMVFISRDMKVLRHGQSDADVSDHKALVCEFEIIS